jgi:biotin operon repressor
LASRPAPSSILRQVLPPFVARAKDGPPALGNKTKRVANVLTCLSQSDRVQFKGREMPYERSQALENRLQEILGLLRNGRHSSPTLAEAVKTSQPTISRCLAALRKRGYQIRAVKDERGWSYQLSDSKGVAKPKGLS